MPASIIVLGVIALIEHVGMLILGVSMISHDSNTDMPIGNVMGYGITATTIASVVAASLVFLSVKGCRLRMRGSDTEPDAETASNFALRWTLIGLTISLPVGLLMTFYTMFLAGPIAIAFPYLVVYFSAKDAA